MKLKYSISYFVILTSFVIAFIYMYAFNNQQQLDGYIALENTTEEIIISNSDEVISEGYYLKEDDGFIVVYLFDNETLVLETDILFDSVPDDLQAEIQEGKYIETPEELYSFLENYSS